MKTATFDGITYRVRAGRAEHRVGDPTLTIPLGLKGITPAWRPMTRAQILALAHDSPARLFLGDIHIPRPSGSAMTEAERGKTQIKVRVSPRQAKRFYANVAKSGKNASEYVVDRCDLGEK